jgi:hypothetical protein
MGNALIMDHVKVHDPYCKKLSSTNMNPPRREYIKDINSILLNCPLKDKEDCIIDGSRKLTYEDAKIVIKTYLKGLEAKGETKFGILDIMSVTNLPVEQIEHILDDLKIKENE